MIPRHNAAACSLSGDFKTSLSTKFLTLQYLICAKISTTFTKTRLIRHVFITVCVATWLYCVRDWLREDFVTFIGIPMQSTQDVSLTGLKLFIILFTILFIRNLMKVSYLYLRCREIIPTADFL